MTTQQDFYVAALGNSDNAGIYSYSINGCKLMQRHFQRINDASYLARPANSHILYAALENKENGGLATFRINADGSLELLSEQRTPNMGFCHLAVSPDEKTVYTADYVNGTVAEFSLYNGRITSYDIPIRHSGHGPHVPRQQGPHVHYCIFTPDAKYLCVIDLGVDCVFCYPLNADFKLSGEEPKRNQITPAGSGPRHLIFSGDGQTAYLVNELSNTIMVFAYHDGELTHRQTLPMLPENTQVFSKAAAIRMSPDGRFILASNRGYDTIATYAVEKEGSLSNHSLDFIGAKSPRDFNFLPGGNAVLVGGELSGDAYLFKYDRKAGRLTPDGTILQELPKPICIF